MSIRLLAETLPCDPYRLTVRDLDDATAQVPLLTFDTPFEAAIYLVFMNHRNSYMAEAGEEPTQVILRDLDTGAVALSYHAPGPTWREFDVDRLCPICMSAART